MDLTYNKKPAAFVLANPDCTFEEFQKATGCNKQAWYDSRSKAKMKKYITTGRLKAETKFVIANPNINFEDFQKANGGDRNSYIAARGTAKAYLKRRGLDHLITPFRKKKVPRSKLKVAEPVPPVPPVEPKDMFKQQRPEQEQLKNMYARDGIHQFNESVSFGVTPEFIWYESTIIRSDMEKAMNRFDRLVRVMEARHAENNKMLGRTMDELSALRRENKSLGDLLEARTKPEA